MADHGSFAARERPGDRSGEDRAALAAALHRVADGDAGALEDVYRRTSMKLFGLCLRILPDRAEAEDVLQEIYIVVWRKAGGFDPARGTAMTWLLTLARNRAVDRLRAGGRHPAGAIDAAVAAVVDHRPSAFDLIAASDDERRMAGCLAGLDGRDARLIDAAFFGGTTYADLAMREGSPLGTIKSRIRRALISLRECLQ